MQNQCKYQNGLLDSRLVDIHSPFDPGVSGEVSLRRDLEKDRASQISLW